MTSWTCCVTECIVSACHSKEVLLCCKTPNIHSSSGVSEPDPNMHLLLMQGLARCGADKAAAYKPASGAAASDRDVLTTPGSGGGASGGAGSFGGGGGGGGGAPGGAGGQGDSRWALTAVQACCSCPAEPAHARRA